MFENTVVVTAVDGFVWPASGTHVCTFNFTFVAMNQSEANVSALFSKFASRSR